MQSPVNRQDEFIQNLESIGLANGAPKRFSTTRKKFFAGMVLVFVVVCISAFCFAIIRKMVCWNIIYTSYVFKEKNELLGLWKEEKVFSVVPSYLILYDNDIFELHNPSPLMLEWLPVTLREHHSNDHCKIYIGYWSYWPNYQSYGMDKKVTVRISLGGDYGFSTMGKKNILGLLGLGNPNGTIMFKKFSHKVLCPYCSENNEKAIREFNRVIEEQ